MQSAADVLEDLRLTAPRPHMAAGPLAEIPDDGEVDEARRTVLELLSPSPVAVDELVRRCHLSPAVVASVLLELELAGRVGRHAGNRVALS